MAVSVRVLLYVADAIRRGVSFSDATDEELEALRLIKKGGEIDGRLL